MVTALRPLLRDRSGSWIGWSGDEGGPSKPITHDGMKIHPVALSAEELEGFYSGFSNETLWPLYHDGLRTPRFHREWWRTYVEVNRKYTDTVAPLVGPESIVWIHDYHLQLVPGMLRARHPGIKIGFFLHIPFPALELFVRLPWRREVLEGLLGADLLGFQSRLSTQNCRRAGRRYADGGGAGSRLHYQGRDIRALPFPISIDVGEFETVAASEGVQRRVDELRRRIGPERKILLGVDRLDYTKGIDVRLRAFEDLLAGGRFTTSEVCMIQIAVPSRGDVPDYTAMRRVIEETVGRINGEYAEPGRVAVHYLHHSLDREELVAYYRAADVMMVTPLRDGMNLVAKEYVACRLDDSGVLILSEFAGAANELRHALLVNPFDIDGMANIVERALTIAEPDRRQRMRSLRKTIRAHDLYDWAADFLGALAGENRE